MSVSLCILHDSAITSKNISSLEVIALISEVITSEKIRDIFSEESTDTYSAGSWRSSENFLEFKEKTHYIYFEDPSIINLTYYKNIALWSVGIRWDKYSNDSNIKNTIEGLFEKVASAFSYKKIEYLPDSNNPKSTKLLNQFYDEKLAWP